MRLVDVGDVDVGDVHGVFLFRPLTGDCISAGA